MKYKRHHGKHFTKPELDATFCAVVGEDTNNGAKNVVPISSLAITDKQIDAAVVGVPTNDKHY